MRASPAPAARVVIVTLDNHLSGAVERAQAHFAAEGAAISIGFHAAADWDRHKRALDGSSISTIHGFCGTLLRQYATAAGLDPGFEVLRQKAAKYGAGQIGPVAAQ